MNKVITEDIIKQALNESIDEFMLEEAWGSGLKNWWNNSPNAQKIKNVGNSLWNGVKMYMDYRTNGQWNQKYSQYVNGNTKMGELFYLNKWLSYYKQELNSIIYKANNPSKRDDYELWTRNPDNGEETMRKNRYDYVGVNGAIAYAKQYCTFQNFNDYIRAINPDRESVKYINSFIFNYITKSANKNDLNTVLNNLNINVFYSSKYGKDYLEINRKEQQTAQADRRSRIQNAWNNRKSQQQKNNHQQSQQTTNQQQTPYGQNSNGYS